MYDGKIAIIPTFSAECKNCGRRIR